MARKVLHASKIVKAPFGGTRTTTLCERMQLGNDGMNVADTNEKVTCRLCIRELQAKAARGRRA